MLLSIFVLCFHNTFRVDSTLLGLQRYHSFGSLLQNRCIDEFRKTGRLVESCRGNERRVRERHFLFLGGWSSLSHSSIPKLKPGQSKPSTKQSREATLSTVSLSILKHVTASKSGFSRKRRLNQLKYPPKLVLYWI